MHTNKQLSEMTMDDLRLLAKHRGISEYKSLRQTDLITAVILDEISHKNRIKIFDKSGDNYTVTHDDDTCINIKGFPSMWEYITHLTT